MASLSKVERSNKAHKRLSRIHNDKSNTYSYSHRKSFWLKVKSYYHDSVAFEQAKFCKILTRNEKRNLYRLEVNSLADLRKDVNKTFGLNQYIPKKYR